MTTRRVRAIVATTHPMQAYGGIQLAQSVIRQLADQIAWGGIPMRYHHDLSRPVTGTNVIAGVEQMDDGEYAAWIEFDVDEDEWGLFEGERLAAGTRGGFSFSTAEPYASRGKPPFDVEISADAAYYDDKFVQGAATECLPKELTVELARLYQFSVAPDPKIVIDIVETVIVGISLNLLSAYLYDFLHRCKGKVSRGSPTPTFEIRMRRTRRSTNTTVKIEATDDAGLRRAMESLPDILSVEGRTASWDSSAHGWREVAGASTGDAEAPLAPEGGDKP